MVELMLCMGIIALIASVGIVSWTSQSAQAQEEATRQELDAIRRAIELSQTSTHKPWRDVRPPREGLAGSSGDGPARDRWGGEFRVNPLKHLVYSPGLNGLDELGEGDDIALSYDAIDRPRLRAPQRLRLTSAGPPVCLAWEPMDLSPPLAGYRVERRSERETTWTVLLSPASVPPSPTPTYVDTLPITSPTAFYRVVAVGFPGTPDSPPSDQVGWSSVLTNR